MGAFRVGNGHGQIEVPYIIDDTKAYDLDYWFTSIAPEYPEQKPTPKKLVLPDMAGSVSAFAEAAVLTDELFRSDSELYP